MSALLKLGAGLSFVSANPQSLNASWLNSGSNPDERVEMEELCPPGHELGTKEVMIDIGWCEKKRATQCHFGGSDSSKFSCECPHGGAVAWNACKKQLSRFKPCEMKRHEESQEAGLKGKGGIDINADVEGQG